MKRRQFLKTASLAAAGTAAVAAPAIAQSAPEVKWRVTTSFPRSLDTIHGAAETVAKYVSDATDGKFQMQVFAGGEIAHQHVYGYTGVLTVFTTEPETE